MPQIYDNIDQKLLPTLCKTLEVSQRADFCVGYFNLTGWKQVDSFIEKWSGEDNQRCRLLIGMQQLPQDELRDAKRLFKEKGGIDNQTALRLKKRLAEDFRNQLTLGAPNNNDEAALRKLSKQIKSKKVVVKLFLRPLHAKLYLLFRSDPFNPIIGYLGSSNLTFAGLSHQGELNVDVLDLDACKKLAKWFEDRWNDRWCIDISDELVEIIEDSWAREDLIPPFHIYVDMAYHLSREARAGLAEFDIPRDFGQKLFDFQIAAVKIAAHHLNTRGGVLIGDVVGLGKTLMATALIRIFEDDQGFETLIICPKNLVKMWEDYRDDYKMRAKVLSISQVIRELPTLRRYRLVVIDESHNLRNREGKRYRSIQEYIQENECKVILLTATPYNKTYLDLSNQLRLFVSEDKDLGVRPEKLLRELGETEFLRRHQCPVRSLAAFEKSEYADDWRDLMRLYLVRRTRSFIQENYAEADQNGRKYLTFEDGTRSYFPERKPKTIKFEIDDKNPSDQYAKLYAPDVVDTINSLILPRYGLGNYILSIPQKKPSADEAKILLNLSRAGKQLKGFCRTNLFKRLESTGQVFIQSIERHILRNYVFLHAIENDKPLPIGVQDVGLLDARIYDEDSDLVCGTPQIFDENSSDDECIGIDNNRYYNKEEDFKRRAAGVYEEYSSQYERRFTWLSSEHFSKDLARDLEADALALIKILQKCGYWNPVTDTKLSALRSLLINEHPNEKVIIFTQFADTVRYLETELLACGISKISGVTGDSPDPTYLAWRFSPISNKKYNIIDRENELRILIATDVLSEGQNLQDGYIVINYDLPWAIIRLIQRAGRVDRIGQQSDRILCYSFLPADGVERILRLRARVRQRLQENAEVVGTDEAFFEDDRDDAAVLNLYNEKSGILDGDADTEVDLASYAYQIWKNAITKDPRIEKVVPQLPPVVYSTKRSLMIKDESTKGSSKGVLVYVRTAEGNDSLAWIDGDGKSVTESQFSILRAAQCQPETPALPRFDEHHELVKKGVEMILKEEKAVGGQLGRPSGARFRTYDRLKRYAEAVRGTLASSKELFNAIDEIYRYPMRQTAIDTLNRQLRSGISDEMLAELVLNLRDQDRLCIIRDEEQEQDAEPKIICSMGLLHE